MIWANEAAHLMIDILQTFYLNLLVLSGANVIKLFTSVINIFSSKARVFVFVKLFKLSLTSTIAYFENS